MEIVAGDIGGTHARFALAEVEEGRVISLGEPVVLRTGDYPGLEAAWAAFARAIGRAPPSAASFALAGPVTGGPVRFINNSWVVDPATLTSDLGLERCTVLNDFGAMAHAVDALDGSYLAHLLGPEQPLPAKGAISVIGPGTGLGVAVLQRHDPGHDPGITILETEGAHIHFAPLDEAERGVEQAITSTHRRCSVERVVSGPGLGDILRATTPGDSRDDASLWADALAGADDAAIQALDLFLAAYGAAAGDLSLAHGSLGVVLTGGLTNRLAPLLAGSRFHTRFVDKGRYAKRMAGIPIKLMTHPQPGLFGAAAAFAREYAIIL